jgi:diaminopropionate ammonia-lyase
MSSRIFINQNRNPLPPFPTPNAEVRVFHESLPQYKPSPLVSLREVAKDIGVSHVLLKDESSRLGLSAFKILGASWATARAIIKKLDLANKDGIQSNDSSADISLQKLAPAAQAADLTLYAATDGNHGRAVARMAKYLGIKARIFVPSMLDEEAKSKIANEGATVEVFAGDYDQTVVATKAAAEKHLDGMGLLISDTALEIGDETAQWIVDGYQTMFDEIEEQVLEITRGDRLTHVITPVGVGSLAQAVVTHFGRTSRAERTSVVTVEPRTAACLKTSLEAGQMMSINAEYTICSGMCCGTLSANGWPILKDGVEMATIVDDEEVDKAVRELVLYGVHAGPCGAASLAALRGLSNSGLSRMAPEAVVVILCTEGRRGYQMHEEN